MSTNDVTLGQGVTTWPSVTEGPGVSPYMGVTGGVLPVVLPDLALMTNGILLLMTGGSLQLV
jgi:hypothetical protein